MAAAKMEISVRPQRATSCSSWAAAGRFLFSRGFIRGGEMLSFGIMSNALTVMVIMNIQFIYVFSTCSQDKTNTQVP